MKRSVLWTILTILAIVIIVPYIYSGVQAGEDAQNDMAKDPFKETKYIPIAYQKILGDTGISFITTTQTKYRNSVSEFNYKSNYYIQICRIDSAVNRPLSSLITLVFGKKTQNETGESYLITSQSYPAAICYKLGKSERANNIILKLSGDESRQLIKNDSIACYSTILGGFSVKYSEHGPEDVYGKISDNSEFDKVPIDIVFYKHLGNIYFITMSPVSKMKLDPSSLYSIISKRAK